MDLTQESALQYAQRLGLFHDHRHGQFSPQSCLASIQTTYKDPLEHLAGHETLSSETDLPNGDTIVEQESFTDRIPNELKCTAQTRSRFPNQPDPLKDLLLELPDMGPSTSTNSDAFSYVIGFVPRACLFSEYLPLISVDQREDQGLDFPPHIDRLHQALLQQLDVLDLANEKDYLRINIVENSKVFSVQEDEITPPGSPNVNRPPVVDNLNRVSTIEEKRPRSPTPSPRAAKQHRTSEPCYSGKHKQQAIQNDPDATVPSTSVLETRPIQQVEHFEVKDLSQEEVACLVDVKPPGHPGYSFFEDAFFSCNEKDVGIEVESMASILEQIDGLLLPLPDVPTSELSHLGANNATLPTTLDTHLPPLLVDPVLEEALQWAPPPPRRGGQFEAEPMMRLKKQSVAKTQEIFRVGTLGTIQDGEIEEYPKMKKSTNPPPTPPPSHSLDSLIKLRLKKSASERVEKRSSGALSSRSRFNDPILPSTDDPGATSKLVSAFMSLRGIQPARSKLK